MLTEPELDDALRFLYRPAEPATEQLNALRARLTTETEPNPSWPARRRRPQRRRWLLAAAVVGILIAGGLVVPAWFGGTAGNTAAAAQLSTAADAAAVAEDTIPPGQYRYVDTHAWYLNTTMTASPRVGATYSVLVESRQQQWIPARWEDDWMERRSTTGAAVFAAGNEEAARADGALNPSATAEPDLIGPCQDYFTDLCTNEEGSWSLPTREWINALPTDPATMFELLSADAQGKGQSHEAEMLVLATDALRTGLLTASTRATLYRAMAMIPGIEITDDQANLDGAIGTAFAVRGPSTLDETIIDTSTGAFIGERETATSGETDGTVIGYTAVRTAIVDAMGET